MIEELQIYTFIITKPLKKKELCQSKKNVDKAKPQNPHHILQGVKTLGLLV